MNENRLDQLFHALLEESLSEKQRAELHEILESDAGARSRYRRVMALHSSLIRVSKAALPSFVANTPAPRKRWHFRPLVAAIVILSLWSAFLLTSDYLAIRNLNPKAEVIRLSGVRWPAGAMELQQGKLPKNTAVELLAGVVEIGYPSGARVVVEAPCRFLLTSKEALTLLHGRASVHAPDGAEGFRIDSPGGSFIDRGTEFGVAVGSDGSQPVVLAEVFKGEIEILSEGRRKTRLTDGESRAVIGDGELLERLDESPVRLVNALHRASTPLRSSSENLALGKPVMSPGYCTRPHGSVFPPSNLTDGRLDDSGVPGDWSFWLARDGENGEFTVDLLRAEAVSRIVLQNTSNRGIDDRGTAAFSLLGSLDNKSFFPLIDGKLPRVDPAENGYPFHDFIFPATEVRFIKFVVMSHYRHPQRADDHPCQGGGLNEIRIFKK